MLGLGLNLNKHRTISGGFSAEYKAVLSESDSQGYTAPSEAHQTLQNQLILDLIDLGVWDKMDAFYSLAGSGDINFSLINWKSPGTYTNTIVNSPVKSDDGITFNGSDNYIDLGIIPGTDGGNWDLEEGSLGFSYFADPTVNAYNGTSRAFYRMYPGAQWSIFNVNNTYDVFTTGSTNLLNKLLHGDQDSSVGTVKTYHSGVEVHSTNKGPNVKPSRTFTIGADHSGASAYSNLVDSSMSIVYLGGSMRSEIVSLSSLIETYIGAI